MESCDPTFTETSHFPASLLDCTTSLPLIVDGYNTTTSLASTAFPTTTSFESMVNNNDSGDFHYSCSSGRLSTTVQCKSMMATPASRTTTSFPSMVTGLNYQAINGSLPSEYLRDPFPQKDSEIQPYVGGQPLSPDDSEILPGTEF